MTGYEHLWDFERDTARLIAAGATLRDLYDAFLTIANDKPRTAKVSQADLRALSQTWMQSPTFASIRLRELFGGLEVEHTDDYVLAMVGHLGGRREHELRLHMLRHDAGLRDETFWRIFEVEGGGEISLANIDKYSRDDLNWHDTVVLLSNEGSIDRTRLLRSCLEALNRDFSAYRAGWFSQVYTALAPSASESAPDQDLLRLSLGSTVTATVSLAVRHLVSIQKQGLLDAAEFVDACAPAIAGSKAAAMGVLRMLATIASSEPAAIGSIAEVAAEGMTHPHADVQRAAVTLLTKLGREDVARASRAALAPAVAAELLPESAPASEVVARSPMSAKVGALRVAEPVVPWTDDDARERFAALLEFGTNAIELELGMAWLATTERAAGTLAPLTKRARRVQSHDGRFWIAGLVLAAVEPESDYLPQEVWQQREILPSEEEKTVLPSLVTRLREVASILQGRAARRHLLATPTDSSGRVDPDTLLNRLDRAPTPFPVDLTQAILRVPSADRDRVLTASGAPAPAITHDISVEWWQSGSTQLKPDGSPMWTWWNPVIVAEDATEASATQPAFIPSSGEGLGSERGWREMSDFVAESFALVTPESSLPLVAVAIPVLHHVLSEVNHAAGPLLRGLASHPGPWSPVTAQIVALGMAAYDAGLRTEAVELFVSAVPSRLDAPQAAIGFAACQPVVVVNRWAASFADAATIAPDVVIDLLTHLLPKLERDTRGIGALLSVLVDESIRQRRAVDEPELRAWLGAFTGGSGAAKAAKSALSLTGS